MATVPIELMAWADETLDEFVRHQKAEPVSTPDWFTIIAYSSQDIENAARMVSMMALVATAIQKLSQYE